MKLLARMRQSAARMVLRNTLVPLLRAADYDAASQGRRLFKWAATSSGPNSLVSGNASVLLQRSRDAARKNPWACQAIDSYVGNAIGTGITPRFRHPDPKIRLRLQKLWLAWTDESDAEGNLDFYGQQALACRENAEGGEIFARLRPRRTADKMTVPMQIQLIEPEQVPVTKTEALGNGSSIRMGIEFNAIGKRVAYHMYREHPNEGSMLFFNSGEISRVPAESVVHVFKPLRAGQVRGLPWLTPVLTKLYLLDSYDDAELERKRTTALFGGFIKRGKPTMPVLPATATIEDGDNTTPPAGTDFVGLEPGSFVELNEGDEVQFAEPKDVGGMYTEFMVMQLRSVAAGLGITYEMLTGDVSRVNFTSSRVGTHEARRRIEQFQYFMMVFQFCRPIMNAWLDHAALGGAIDPTDYLRNRELYRDVEWRTPRWPFINPVDDVKAEVMQIRALLKARSQSIAEQGEDAEKVDETIAEDNERSDSLGLVGDADPRKTSASGQQSSQDGDLPDDQRDDRRNDDVGRDRDGGMPPGAESLEALVN